jgi:hypothetical protein
MNAVGSLVETLAGFVDGLGSALHLRAERSFENIADDWAGMTVRRGRLARTIADLDNRHPQMAAIQPRQSMGERGSRLCGLVSRCIAADLRGDGVA